MKNFELQYPIEGATALNPRCEEIPARCGTIIAFPGQEGLRRPAKPSWRRRPQARPPRRGLSKGGVPRGGFVSPVADMLRPGSAHAYRTGLQPALRQCPRGRLRSRRALAGGCGGMRVRSLGVRDALRRDLGPLTFTAPRVAVLAHRCCVSVAALRPRHPGGALFRGIPLRELNHNM